MDYLYYLFKYTHENKVTFQLHTYKVTDTNIFSFLKSDVTRGWKYWKIIFLQNTEFSSIVLTFMFYLETVSTYCSTCFQCDLWAVL